LNGEPIPEPLRQIFWEGACVVAAHQERVRRGDMGYVDHKGALNPDFSSTEARIATFRAEGEAVIG
jgi:hypothetical protein